MYIISIVDRYYRYTLFVSLVLSSLMCGGFMSSRSYVSVTNSSGEEVGRLVLLPGLQVRVVSPTGAELFCHPPQNISDAEKIVNSKKKGSVRILLEQYESPLNEDLNNKLMALLNQLSNQSRPLLNPEP